MHCIDMYFNERIRLRIKLFESCRFLQEFFKWFNDFFLAWGGGGGGGGGAVLNLELFACLLF